MALDPGANQSPPRPDGPTPPLRVLLVTPTVNTFPGGIAVQAERFAAALNQDVRVQLDIQPIVPEARGVFRRLQQVPVARTLVTAVLYWSQLIRRIPRYDVIHVNSARFSSFMISSLPAVVIAKICGRRVILNYRNGDLERELRQFRIFRRLLAWPDVLVVPSGFLAAVLRSAGLEAAILANQVDTGLFRYRERTSLRPRFLSCRHFEDFYDVPTVIRAFARIQQVHPDSTLVVAGQGSQEAKIRELVAKLRLNGVTFVGQVGAEAMPALYDDADILLNSSKVDNAPNSLIEALTSGLPIVSTDAGGIRFIVADGDTGWLVPVSDAAALANAAIRALGETGRTLAMARAGRADAEKRFDWDHLRDRWLELYRGGSLNNGPLTPRPGEPAEPGRTQPSRTGNADQTVEAPRSSAGG